MSTMPYVNPLWIRAQSGEYVNLAHMEALLVEPDDDTDTHFCVVAAHSRAEYPLTNPLSQEQANAVRDRLMSLLRVHVISIHDVMASPPGEAQDRRPQKA